MYTIHGSDAKRLLAYSPNTPKDTKLISYLFFRSCLSIEDGLDKAKKPFQWISLHMCYFSMISTYQRGNVLYLHIYVTTYVIFYINISLQN
jgi:hypothetical protein